MAINGINPARFLIVFAKENVIPRIWLTFLWKLMHVLKEKYSKIANAF